VLGVPALVVVALAAVVDHDDVEAAGVVGGGERRQAGREHRPVVAGRDDDRDLGPVAAARPRSRRPEGAHALAGGHRRRRETGAVEVLLDGAHALRPDLVGAAAHGGEHPRDARDALVGQPGAQQQVPRHGVAEAVAHAVDVEEAAAAHREAEADVVGPREQVGRPGRAEPRVGALTVDEPVVVPDHEVDERVAVRGQGHVVEALGAEQVAGAHREHEVGVAVGDGGVHGLREPAGVAGPVRDAVGLRPDPVGGCADRDLPVLPALLADAGDRPRDRLGVGRVLREDDHEHRRLLGRGARVLALTGEAPGVRGVRLAPGGVRRLLALEQARDRPGRLEAVRGVAQLLGRQQRRLRDLATGAAERQDALGDRARLLPRGALREREPARPCRGRVCCPLRRGGRDLRRAARCGRGRDGGDGGRHGRGGRCDLAQAALGGLAALALAQQLAAQVAHPAQQQLLGRRDVGRAERLGLRDPVHGQQRLGGQLGVGPSGAAGGRGGDTALPLRLLALLPEHRVPLQRVDRLHVGEAGAAEQLGERLRAVAPDVVGRLDVGVDEGRVERVVGDRAVEVLLEDRVHVGRHRRDPSAGPQALVHDPQGHERVARHDVLEDVAHVDLVDLVGVLPEELGGLHVDVGLHVAAGVDVRPALHVDLAAPEVDPHRRASVLVSFVLDAMLQEPGMTMRPRGSDRGPGWTWSAKAWSRKS
jgi:hypothetical protein